MSESKPESRSPRTTPFVSAFTAGKIVEVAGTRSLAVSSLRAQLEARGIDVGPAITNLPADEPGEIEAVSRLVSLARGNGLLVQITSDEPGGFRVVLPRDEGMLQSGHHAAE